MGIVVPFPSREPDAAAKAAAILERIAQRRQAQEAAREMLPRVLATMLQAGEKDAVLQAVLLWGSGAAEPEEVLQHLNRREDGPN